MRDLMIDLETLGSNYGSVITQIGACYFDRYSGEVGGSFSVNIDIDSCLKEGLTVEGGAIKFWHSQPNWTFLENAIPLREALEKYRVFSKGAEAVWSHATFDFSMLLSVCFKLGIKPVNRYSITQDIRTLVRLAGNAKKDDEIRPDAHDALADCKNQVRYCVEAFNLLRKP